MYTCFTHRYCTKVYLNSSKREHKETLNGFGTEL